MRLRCLALALVLFAACGDGGSGSPFLPGSERGWATLAYGVSACDNSDGRLRTRRALRLFANPGLDVDRNAGALQRYYHRWGIEFFTTWGIETTDTAFVHDLDNAALGENLRRDFPGVDLSDAGLDALARRDPAQFDRVVKTVLNFQFRGVINFLKTYDLRGQGSTNLVLLRDLFTAQSPEETRTGVLGVAMSPFLISELLRSGMDAGNALRLVDLPADFAPVMFISETNVARIEKLAGAVQRDLVVGHEFGHSAGLVHREDPTNLMNPSTNGSETCALGLTDAQVAVMQKGLGIAKVAARVLPGEESPRDALAPSPRFIGGLIRGEPAARNALYEPFFIRH